MDVFDAGKINPKITPFQTDLEYHKIEDAETSEYSDVWTKFLIAVDKEKGDIVDKCVKVFLTWGGKVKKNSDYMHFIASIRILCGGKREVLEALVSRMCGLTYREIEDKYGKSYVTYYNHVQKVFEKKPELEKLLTSVLKCSNIVRNE